MEKILKEIVENRLKVIQKKGITFGINIPGRRKLPLSLPDFHRGIIICEIKRGSPSEGKMNDIEAPVKWAGKYIEAGAGVISILTEENYFYGNLQDLIDIKTKYPRVPLLRKDFLLSEDEIDVSYRAGADIVLLIVSVLTDLDNGNIELLRRMKEKAEGLGMMALIEVHNLEELEKILPLHPELPVLSLYASVQR